MSTTSSETPAGAKIDVGDNGKFVSAGGDDQRTIAPDVARSLSLAHNEFAAFHEEYLSKYIAMADGKAALMLGLSGSLVAFLISLPEFPLSLSLPITSEWALGMSSLCLLVLSATSSLLTILPRLPRKGESIVFWAQVVDFGNADRFIEAVAMKSEPELTRARLIHSFNLSMVCTAKYLWLRRSLLLGFAGAFASACCLLVVKG